MGGVQVILCGDFMQLPPVAKNSKTPPYLFTSPTFNKYITTRVQLCKSFRQQGDNQLLTVLNKIREGVVDDFVNRTLMSRLKLERDLNNEQEIAV